MTRIACFVGMTAAVVLWLGTARATQTAQEKCDQARVTAWKTFVSCVDKVVATDAGCKPNASCKASFDEFAAFAKCRHTYFKNWTSFKGKKALAGSTCIGSRFTSTDSGATVTDALTGLVWEVKDNVAGGSSDYSDPHDVNNQYAWSTGPPWAENGTAFTSFLGTVNGGGGFAGSNGWRLPTLAELQTILLDFACTGTGGGPKCSCASDPCIDAKFGPTWDLYLSVTGYVPDPAYAWCVLFFPFSGDPFAISIKDGSTTVRAVRGGL